MVAVVWFKLALHSKTQSRVVQPLVVDGGGPIVVNVGRGGAGRGGGALLR